MQTMRKLAVWLWLLGLGLVWPVALPAAPLDNAACWACHDGKSQTIQRPGPAGDKAQAMHGVAPEAYAKGVHAKLACTRCHTGVTDNPAAGAGHQYAAGATGKSADCAGCHQKLWDQARADNTAASRPRLGTVAENAEAYRKSFHARPSKKDASRPLASCENCHASHSFNIPPKASPAHEAWRLDSPATCGKNCHEEALETYADSVHGKALSEKKDTKAPVCADCHTAHAVGNTSGTPFKLAVTASCGSCHEENFKSYKSTYHGKISTLGYAHTAKCYDCHGSHGVLAVKDKASKVHPDNRMETCKECHNGKKGVSVAAAGFASFQPHANTHDFKRYPQVWLGWQMMVGLLVGTFGFFWLHTAMWFWAELRDRRRGVARAQVLAEALPAHLRGKHFQRFSRTWRIAHITFALSLMVLTVTGMPMFYPDAAWAPWVMKTLGGPQVAGTIHRVNAVIFATVFFWHLAYIAWRLWQRRKTFRWLGPDSLIPNLQDLKDIVAMFTWFVGKGPRPVFDRWTYWEKFDYWAPFWGVTIIGVSGLMMWLPHLTASFLPGWVFNVAAIFHGEEAFLAVVFLFTVHFFNNHFRPDKFPVEVVMFTGSMSVEHMAREHPLEYQRLKDAGELDRYIVAAPSAPMALASRLLGFALIALGLTLLFGVAVGFFGGR
ncbi:cytochrome b subunit of formate dehydrogenase [Burkholderiales bacterium JOSHI_001]|nr:cytochrome b subunit of formate dehydrogenase [Burkholderiales bacterium JOSHI_001]